MTSYRIGLLTILASGGILPLTACQCGTEARPFVGETPETACETTEVVFARKSPPAEPAAPTAEPTVRVYVDVSQPMGGFVPLADTEVSTFQETLSVLPEVLAHHYELGADGDVQWRGVSKGVRTLSGKASLMRRSAYTGSQTDLPAALTEAVADVMSGEIRAAVLVSDLVATGDRVGGGQTAAALREWLLREDVRAGAFGLGLLGVRASYSGVRGRGCDVPKGSGCRFSEDLGRWVPLTEATDTPFYVVVIGRNAENVQAVGERVLRDLGLGDDGRAQWELLNLAGSSPSARLSCDFRRKHERVDQMLPQTTLLHLESGLKCTDAVEVPSSCRVTSEDGRSLGLKDGFASWEAASLDLGDPISLVLDCEALSAAPPSDPLNLVLDVEPDPSSWSDWSDWSTAMDASDESIGRTLRLQYFVDALRVRPTAYRLTCDEVLPSFAP